VAVCTGNLGSSFSSLQIAQSLALRTQPGRRQAFLCEGGRQDVPPPVKWEGGSGPVVGGAAWLGESGLSPVVGTKTTLMRLPASLCLFYWVQKQSSLETEKERKRGLAEGEMHKLGCGGRRGLDGEPGRLKVR
jgi:hypothetical protein